MANPVTNLFRRTRRMVNQSLGRDIRVPIQHRCRFEVLGTEYGGWGVCPDAISSDSVVYSFGVGRDISFDLALIEKYGAQVHGFDPTPKSIQWIRQQSLPAQFHFHELGLADFDGQATFVLPRADFVSFTLTDRSSPAGSENAVRAEVRRLSTIARMLGHNSIDILKMDIEGSEYKVIDDLANCTVAIRQLLVEFHHTIGKAVEVARTAAAIKKLNVLGFKLFYNTVVGREYSFIRV